MFPAIHRIPVDIAPFGLSGTVYGVLLNHRSAYEALSGQMDQPPYNAAPRAPIMFVKPRNTLAADGDTVRVSEESKELEVRASLGIVMGRTACRVPEAQALAHVAGFLIVNDLSVAHPNYFRPSVRFKARDGFCPMGPRVTPRESAGDPDAMEFRTYIDGVLVQSASTADFIRSTARLLAEVTDFMTLSPGDVLAVGGAVPAPRVRAGQTVAIEAAPLGRLTNRFVAGGA